MERAEATNLDSIERPESLARRAYYALRKAIRDRSLEPETLYSELQLAAAMNISRTPVREALIELSREGIIDVVPQRGFRVRTITEDEEREVFDLRGAIESYVVRRLATLASRTDVRELREVLARQASTADDPALFLELDEAFHLTMPSLLGLNRTRETLGTLRGIIFLSGLAALSDRDRPPAVLAEHRAIVDGIAAGDPNRAASALMIHLERTIQHSRGLELAEAARSQGASTGNGRRK